MKVGTPHKQLLPAFDIPKKAQPKAMTPPKPLKPAPHPQQARLEQYRGISSLVTDRNKNPVVETYHEKECGK